MSVDYLRTTMPAWELTHWLAYFNLKNAREAEQRQEAELEAKARANMNQAKRI